VAELHVYSVKPLDDGGPETRVEYSLRLIRSQNHVRMRLRGVSVLVVCVWYRDNKRPRLSSRSPHLIWTASVCGVFEAYIIPVGEVFCGGR